MSTHQKLFRKRAQSGAWACLVRAGSEDEVLTLHDIDQLHPVLAALYPGSFVVEEVAEEGAAVPAELSAATIAELMCESSRPLAWAPGRARPGMGGAGAPGGTPDERLVQFFNLLEAGLRRGNEHLPTLDQLVEDALDAAAHALGRRLALMDAALAGEAAFAFARGKAQETWREAERKLTGAAPDPTLSFAHVANRLEQSIANLRAVGLWPW